MASVLTKLNNSNEMTWLSIGRVFEGVKDYDKALSAFESVLKHNPANGRALVSIGVIVMGKERFADALGFFKKALQADVENGEIWAKLGECYLRLHDLQRAYDSYRLAIHHLPNARDPAVWFGIGILYQESKSFEQAQQAFRAVLRMDANFDKRIEVQHRLAEVYKSLGKETEAIELFTEALEEATTEAETCSVLLSLGDAYEKQKRSNDSQACYVKVLETRNSDHPKVKEAQDKAAFALARMAMKGSDIDYDLLSQKLENVNRTAACAEDLNTAGRWLMNKRKLRTCIPLLGSAVEKDEENAEYWMHLGEAQGMLGQHHIALESLSRAVRLNVQFARAWLLIGKLYLACNQPTDAHNALSKSVYLDGTKEEAHAELERAKEALFMSSHGGSHGNAMPSVGGGGHGDDVGASWGQMKGTPTLAPISSLPVDAPGIGSSPLKRPRPSDGGSGVEVVKVVPAGGAKRSRVASSAPRRTKEGEATAAPEEARGQSGSRRSGDFMSDVVQMERKEHLLPPVDHVDGMHAMQYPTRSFGDQARIGSEMQSRDEATSAGMLGSTGTKPPSRSPLGQGVFDPTQYFSASSANPYIAGQGQEGGMYGGMHAGMGKVGGSFPVGNMGGMGVVNAGASSTSMMSGGTATGGRDERSDMKVRQSMLSDATFSPGGRMMGMQSQVPGMPSPAANVSSGFSNLVAGMNNGMGPNVGSNRVGGYMGMNPAMLAQQQAFAQRAALAQMSGFMPQMGGTSGYGMQQRGPSEVYQQSYGRMGQPPPQGQNTYLPSNMRMMPGGRPTGSGGEGGQNTSIPRREL
eukprot:CAMPEP_0113873170 /NCGR_PEP_ID=MMETSP0780_2-20120614/3620_1 /TAXON_ID=652834 /ORGANISM="Palpitomonas bilix" /LENGTH=805 /DNA_ID=CAMNT_0000858783 /DNA_START=108 /DNA_END=2525 /DNA_ORIENTATION=+ /assembly_acc=CAM_ASM_000599